GAKFGIFISGAGAAFAAGAALPLPLVAGAFAAALPFGAGAGAGAASAIGQNAAESSIPLRSPHASTRITAILDDIGPSVPAVAYLRNQVSSSPAASPRV